MIQVRVATAADLPALTDLRRAWTEERRGVGPDPSFAERFAAWFHAEAHQRTFWLAEDETAAVGMVNLLRFVRMPGPGIDSAGWGYLGNLYVRPEHRDAGIGTRLLDALIAHADDVGLERIVLSPSERSVPLYRRSGFGAADQLLLRPGPPR